jgi:hypothetical protein
MAIQSKELEFNKNDDEMRLKISALERELSKIFGIWEWNGLDQSC